MTTIFADSVGHVTMANGIVRMELISIVPQPGQDPPARGEKTGQIVLPLNGFISAFKSMQNLMDRLKEAGIVVDNQDRRTATPAAVIPPPAPVTSDPKKLKKRH